METLNKLYFNDLLSEYVIAFVYACGCFMIVFFVLWAIKLLTSFIFEIISKRG